MTMFAGAAEVDITPNVGLPMAGHSTEGKEATGVAGHLFARTLYLEGSNGGRVALCFVDLHAGTRYLLEKVAERTAVSRGIGVPEIVLAGSHTHSAPGNIYGNSMYDSMAQKRSGLDENLANWLASQIAVSIEEAVDNKEAARVGVARAELWGTSRNRSLFPFLNNLNSEFWNDPGWPGASAPAGLSDERKSVDPRVSVIAAFREADELPIAVFATFGCHTTAVGKEAEFYSPDWAGYACRKARWALEQPLAGHRVVVAVALGAAGDTNGLRDDADRPIPQGNGLARRIGSEVGRGIASAVSRARASAAEVPIVTRHAQPAVSDGASFPDPEARLADEWMMGASGMAGSEDGRTEFYDLGLAFEGMIDDDMPEPQGPKAQGAGILQDIVRDITNIQPGPVVPLHAVEIGDHLLVTVPGEPTTFAAYEIEKRILDQHPYDDVTVIGWAGDYFGYFATPREYDLQNYEGGSTLYGRFSARHIQRRIEELVSGPTSVPAPPAAPFVGPRRDSLFELPERIVCRDVAPRPSIQRHGNRVHLEWDMWCRDRPAFARTWFVRVETKQSGKWEPYQHMGRDLDDVYGFIHVWRNGSTTRYSRPARWHARVHLPRGADAKGPLAIRVAKRANFKTFSVEIPEKD